MGSNYQLQIISNWVVDNDNSYIDDNGYFITYKKQNGEERISIHVKEYTEQAITEAILAQNLIKNSGDRINVETGREYK